MLDLGWTNESGECEGDGEGAYVESERSSGGNEILPEAEPLA